MPYLRVANVMRATARSIRNQDDPRDGQRCAANRILSQATCWWSRGTGTPTNWADVPSGRLDCTCTHQNHSIRVRPGLGSLTPEYSSRPFYNSDVGRGILIQNGKTTSGLNTISTRNVKEVWIPLPPTGLQGVFAEQVQRIEALARHLDAAAAKAEAMAAGLSAEVFG